MNQDIEDIRRAARELAGSFSLEYWHKLDATGEYPWEFIRAFAENHWLGIMVPTEYGGAGAGLLEAGSLLEEICASGAGLAGASAIHHYFFPWSSVIRHGSEQLKSQYLPEVAEGNLLMAFAVTEPNAGTDTSRISTSAKFEGGYWVINGQKVWTTNAQNATKILILARTSERTDEAPLRGMTLFLADLDRDACDVRQIEKMARNAVDSNEVFISDLRVPADRVVGEVGNGFYHLLDSLNAERCIIAMEAVGIGKAALELASKYARERIVFDRPIGMNQGIAHPLARAWCELQAAEVLAIEAAQRFDAGEPAGLLANAAKYTAAEASFRAADAALQTFGGYGFAREYHIERIWRESRLYRIGPVSQEMILNFVAERALQLPKSY